MTLIADLLFWLSSMSVPCFDLLYVDSCDPPVCATLPDVSPIIGCSLLWQCFHPEPGLHA